MIAAANYRDQMRAHFLARSAQNLAELVIRLQQRIDNIKQLRGTVQITDFADQVLARVLRRRGGGPGRRRLLDRATPRASAPTSARAASSATITTEDDKINLNCANGNDATAATLKSALDALVFFPAYDPVFEEADAEG